MGTYDQLKAKEADMEKALILCNVTTRSAGEMKHTVEICLKCKNLNVDLFLLTLLPMKY